MSKTKMTVGQAIVKFLNQQYIEMDGKEEPFVDGIFTIFGHGMVVGLGQALEEDPGHLRGARRELLREAAQPPQDHRVLVLDRCRRGEHGHRRPDRYHQ